MLKLKIDNFDKLPNGGPLEHMVDRRGFEFGRDPNLDWSLPDKSRVVSSKHCEVRYYDNAYWLMDLSTNGTFINGSSKRMQSPYRLADGDVLSLGEYLVSVTVQLDPPENAAAGYAPPAPAQGGIWDAPHVAPPPIDARDLMPRPPEADRAPEFLHQAAYVPPVLEPAPFRKPQPAETGSFAPPLPAPTHDPWAAKSKVGAAPEVSPEPVVPAAPPLPRSATPVEPPVVPPPEPVPPLRAPAQPTPPPTTSTTAGGEEFIRRFAAGAGLQPDMLSRNDAGEFAEQAGQLLHLACSHLMAMLHARAEAKALSRSGNRTMIQSSDNNPLKFMPTAEEALRVMLGPRTKGYLDARAALEASFADLKTHQIASLAAMQAAVTQLFDDLSPDAIIKAAESKKSLIPGGKSKQWDTYAERWAARAGRREHGMLGAFLDLFAEQYDKLSKHKP